MWIVSGGLVVLLTLNYISFIHLALMVSSIVIAAIFSLLTLNQSQKELAESNKSHGYTKRQMQEHQLKIDRFKYDSKKAGELRRIVLNSTQEKDHSLQNMASALDYSMNVIIELTSNTEVGTMDQIRTRANGMKRYAADLQALAKLELKAELPEHVEIDFLSQLEELHEKWSQFGKNRKVKIKLDVRDDQMPVISDKNWIENLLSRVVQSLIRLNENTVLEVNLIGYHDAEMGDALRLSFAIDGRMLTELQLKHLMAEYVSIIADGHEVGPGLSFVVARRLAQMLNGQVEVNNGTHGIEVVVVLPRNPEFNNVETEKRF